jgi:hypothetical protein
MLPGAFLFQPMTSTVLHEEKFDRRESALCAIEGANRRVAGSRLLRIRYTTTHAVALSIRPAVSSELTPPTADQPHVPAW